MSKNYDEINNKSMEENTQSKSNNTIETERFIEIEWTKRARVQCLA